MKFRGDAIVPIIEDKYSMSGFGAITGSFNQEDNRKVVQEKIMESIQMSQLLELMIPSGYHGLVLLSTRLGAAVMDVDPGSYLHGEIQRGDLVIFFDNIDTQGMAADEVRAILFERDFFSRRLVLIKNAIARSDEQPRHTFSL